MYGKTVILGAASVWDKEKGLLDFCRLREKLDSRFAIVLVGVTEKQKRKLLPGILALPRTASPGELAKIYSAAAVSYTHLDVYKRQPYDGIRGWALQAHEAAKFSRICFDWNGRIHGTTGIAVSIGEVHAGMRP